MDKKTFEQMAADGYSKIPLVREIIADLDTPLTVYLKLADSKPYTYLLESVQGGEKWGRYSIIGLPCKELIKVEGFTVTTEKDGEVTNQQQVKDPLKFVEEFQAQYAVPEQKQIKDIPRFTGGLVGYFGYDIVRYVEPRLGRCPNPDPLKVPEVLLMVSDEVIVFDNLAGKIYIIVHADTKIADSFESANQRLQQIVTDLREACCCYPEKMEKKAIAETDFVSGFTEDAFKEAVDKIKQYIIDGDCMQVVPSQRMTVPFESSPLDLYRALRCTNPSPYMFMLNLNDFHIVGSSPEILVREEDGIITVRPIAGTRKRGVDEAHDVELEQDLLADPKEIAEHLMLIDLGRNDIGRVAKTGSVKVTEQMVIERYSHVMHIVSNVCGKIKEDMSPIDVLKATFPAGTLSGAPKIRAMEIIDEVEPVKRGVYGGAVGYISYSGNMDTAIAIRTAVIKDNKLHIQAGAGIVADSVPQSEWDETMNKGRSMFRAVDMVEQGFEVLK
ncbi:MAG: anthranilate synthase component I [Gammaproteobacteria bacterium]|nr:MAG: anthranilate synthase component I [Gammaproteobacteria bacterium]